MVEEKTLVIAVSSRALFDLREEAAVFESQGEAAYTALQKERLDRPVAWGAAYPLVKRLLAINERTEREAVSVVLASRNDPVSGMRMLRTIEAEGLRVSSAIFTRGRSVSNYLKSFSVDLFLSADGADVATAILDGIAAARIIEQRADHYTRPGDDEEKVHISVDGDACLFDAEAEKVFQRGGVKAFHAHERAHACLPLGPGPFEPFLRAISRWQTQFEESPVRVALVTARAVAAHARAMNTLESWGIRVDEAHFLGGADKGPVLEAFGALIHFDDSSRHVANACKVVPTGQVPFDLVNLP